jgi:hypothetical protein
LLILGLDSDPELDPDDPHCSKSPDPHIMNADPKQDDTHIIRRSTETFDLECHWPRDIDRT